MAVKRPTRTFDEFFENLKKEFDFIPGTVIDVGAANGTPALHRAFSSAYFILFEPLKEFIPKLERMMKRYNGEIHNCALMSETGESSIFRTKDKFGSSMMHRICDPSDPRLEKVDCKTLGGVLSDRNLPKPFILKTDCQGGDFDVVKGGQDLLKDCEIIIMEVSFFKFWGSHHPDALEIITFMNDHGFVIFDLLDGLYRPLDNSLGQIDIVFVKKDGMFRKKHNWIDFK